MAYKFTKLFILDTVNKVGSYAFKKLSTNGHLFLELSLEGDILTMYGMNEGVNKTITIYDDITPVTSISGVTGMSVTYDLSTLNLASGEHYISAQVSAEGYIDSALVTVTYTVIPSLTAPTIELDEDTLNIYDEEGIATSYDILVDGEVVDSVEAEVDTNFLTFSSPSTFTLGVVDNTKYWNGSLEYSTDAKTWNTWSGTSAISSSTDGKLYMRGTGNTVITGSTASATIARWVLTGADISCSGNIETLLDYATVKNGEHPTMANACFYGLFRDNLSIISSPELPAITLTDSCYRFMFYNCYYLASLPMLPATELKPYCYYGMFYNCRSIAISNTQKGAYTTPYRVPSSGTGTTATSATDYMFTNTVGAFTGDLSSGGLSINTTYYLNVDSPAQELSGTWLFNTAITFDNWIRNESYGTAYYIDFTSNSSTWYRIGRGVDAYDTQHNYLQYYYSNGSTEIVYDTDRGWRNTAYRTITFLQPTVVVKPFYDWLAANATKQS